MDNLKKQHKELKGQVNLKEVIRNNDRSFTSFRELKDLKKMKLLLKDKLLKSKNNERGNKTISKV